MVYCEAGALLPSFSSGALLLAFNLEQIEVEAQWLDLNHEALLLGLGDWYLVWYYGIRLGKGVLRQQWAVGKLVVCGQLDLAKAI